MYKYIFDLDGTLIDSSHRTTKINGVLDLQAWRYNNTPEKILADSLTLLGQLLVGRLGGLDKSEILFLTARDMNAFDYLLLDQLGLSGIRVVSRASCTEAEKQMPDHLLKKHLLKTRLACFGQLAHNFLFVDDDLDNLHTVKSAFKCRAELPSNTLNI